MAGLVDMHMEIVERFREYRENYMVHAKAIKKIAEKNFGRIFGVFVFGSVISKNHHPLSDIDLAIVLFESAGEDARTGFYRDVRKETGMLHPFELHVLTKEEWNDWYRKFVKEYIEIS